MASPLDELVDLPGGEAELDPYLNPPLAGELPAQTDKRFVREERRAVRDESRSNTIKAKDLGQRGIPSFINASGDVSEVRDETGAPLTGHDKRHNIAYDSRGEPKLITFGPEGPPILKDPFADLPERTDPKTGQRYKIRAGLPWQWTGEDPEIAQSRAQTDKDKLLAKESSLIGRKISLEHADLVSATKDRESIHKGLLSEVPLLQDPKYAGADAATIHTAIDEHYNTQYGAPEANKRAGWFSKELSPEAAQLRTDLDRKKADAHAGVDQLFALNDHITQLGDNVEAGRKRELLATETQLAHLEGRPGPLDATEPGQIDVGNIDLNNRPVVKNPDGSVSTERSISIGTNRGEVLIPTVVNGAVVSNEEAIKHYKETGENLGVFETPEAATAYADKIHNRFNPSKLGAAPVDQIAQQISNGSIPEAAQPAMLAAAHDAADANKKADLLDPNLAKQYKGYAQALLHGLAISFAEITKGLPVLEKLTPAGAAQAALGIETPLSVVAPKVAGKIQEAAESDYDKSLSGTLGGKIGNFIGGVTPFLAASLLQPEIGVPVTVSALFSSGYGSTKEDALAHGADPAKAEALGLLSGAINGVLGLPLRGAGKAIMSVFGDTAPKVVQQQIEAAFAQGGMPLVGRLLTQIGEYARISGLNKAAREEVIDGVNAIVKEIKRTPAERALIVGREAAVGAGIGGGVQTAQNIVAQQYDPERGTFEGVPEMAIGFGALAGASTGFQQIMRARQAKQALDLLAKKGGEPPTAGLPGPTAPPPPPEAPPGAPERPVAGREVEPTPTPPAAPTEKVARVTTDYGKRVLEKRIGDLYDNESNDDLAFDRGGIPSGKITQSEAKAKYGKDYEVGQQVVENIGKNGTTILVEEVIPNKGAETAPTPIEPGGTQFEALRGELEAATGETYSDEAVQEHVDAAGGFPTEGGEADARMHIGQEPQIRPEIGAPVQEGAAPTERADTTITEAQPDYANAAPGTAEAAPTAAEGAGETATKPTLHPANVTDAEQSLWRLTRKDNPQLLSDLRKQYGGHEDYLEILDKHINENTKEPRTNAFDVGDHVVIGNERHQIIQSNDLETQTRKVEGGRISGINDISTEALRRRIATGEYALESQAELEKIPGSEQKGEPLPEPTVEGETPGLGEGLVIKPQRVGSDPRKRSRISTPEQVRSSVETNLKANAEHLSRVGTEVKFAPSAAGSGIHTDPGTGHITIDADKVAERANAVYERGGNSDAWIASSLQEEGFHSQQVKAAGHSFVDTYSKIYYGLSKQAQSALAEAYPDTPDQASLGAEYERMVMQHRNGDTITEAHHRDISNLLPILAAKQTDVLENNLKRVLSIAEPGEEAPAEASVPKDHPELPMAEPKARGPPKTISDAVGIKVGPAGRAILTKMSKASNLDLTDTSLGDVNEMHQFFRAIYQAGQQGKQRPEGWSGDFQGEVYAAGQRDAAKKPETTRGGPPLLKEDASFAERRERRDSLQTIAQSAPLTAPDRAVIRTLLQSTTSENAPPRVAALNQAANKLHKALGGEGFEIYKGKAGAPKIRQSSQWQSSDQATFRKQKAQLTKAENAENWHAVIKAADEFEAYWEERGTYPDDWARWARAKEDAQLRLRQMGKGWLETQLKGGEEHAGEKPSTEGVGVRSEGGKVGEGAPLRQSGEAPAKGEKEKPQAEAQPTGRGGEISGLTRAGRFAAFVNTGMPDQAANRLAGTDPQYLMPEQRRILEDYAKQQGLVFKVGDQVAVDEGRGEIVFVGVDNVKIAFDTGGKLSNWIPKSRVAWSYEKPKAKPAIDAETKALMDDAFSGLAASAPAQPKPNLKMVAIHHALSVKGQSVEQVAKDFAMKPAHIEKVYDRMRRPLMASAPQKITHAALKLANGVIVKAPEDKNYHAGVYEKMGGVNDIRVLGAVMGFTTSTGEFLTRDEAHRAAGFRHTGDKFKAGLAASKPNLIGASVPGIVQKDLPEDKVEPFLKLARALNRQGIDTPEKIAGVIPENAWPYAQALWDSLGMVNRSLRGTHDWAKILPYGRSAVVASVGSPAGAVAGEISGTAQSGEVEPVSGERGQQDAGRTERVAVEERGDEAGGSARARSTDVGAPGEPELQSGRTAAPISERYAPVGGVQEPDIGRGRSGVNHRIKPEDELFPSGEVSKTRANIAAIKLLKKLEAEDRDATPEEQKKLAQYVGWGGLSQAFDPFKKLGVQFNEQLRELLTEDEYNAARQSTQNAHYTSREVISSMWDMARHLGFKGGTVSEYGAGVGHFFGLMPEDLAEASNLQAIERDELSARLIGKLYPQAKVKQGALQDLKTKPNSVDLFVGNVPFSDKGPRDDRYPTLNLHNYFLARILDDLKPGGVAVVISTANTLDKQQKQREFLASKSELVGAMRLPNDAFKANAGTEVNADILIFRKPDSQRPATEPFVSIGEIMTHDDKSTIPINEYFVRHPNMILGLPSREGSMYGADEPAIIPFKDPELSLSEALGGAMGRLPRNVFGAVETEPDVDVERAEAGAKDKPGSLIYQGGKLYIVNESKELVPAGELNPRFKQSTVSKRARDFIEVREKYKELIRGQLNPESSEKEVESLRKDLNKIYDKYVKKHGGLNADKTRPFAEDPEYGLVTALEDVRTTISEGKRVRIYNKAAVFERRTQFPYSEPTQADNTRDGMLTSLGYRGRIDLGYVSSLTGKTVEKIEEELESEKLAYLDPSSGNWQTNDHYLSGNVRAKLKAAQVSAESDPRYDRNVEALTGIQPKALPIADINIRLGGAWVPQEVVSRFGRKLFNSAFEASYVPQTDSWVIGKIAYTPEATDTFAGGEMTGNDLFKLALNLKTPRVMDRVWDGDKWRQVFNPSKTAAAQAAQDKIMAEFRKFIIDDEETANLLEDAYNDNFNGHVLPNYDGSHLTLPGSSSEVELRPLQKDVIWRIIQDGYAMIAHAVGAGKTYAMIGAAMEMRRLGLARKPLLVVKNPTLSQFAGSFRKMYPSANVLVGTKEDLTKAKRNQFMARIAAGDWDAVVVAQSSFDRLPSDPEREKAFINGQLAELVEAIQAAKERGERRNDPTVKELEKAKDALSDRLKELMKRAVDNTINFEQLGVDALFIDEAHDYKKPPFITKMDRVGGLQRQVSKRAFALLMKTRFIQEKNKGRNVILATGTPVTNTLGEAWHMLNLGAPHLLDDYGVQTFDRFVSTFATVEPSMELNAAGNWVIKPRLAKFVNGPELLTMIRSGWDVVTTEELHEMFGKLNIDVPQMKGGRTRAIAVERTQPVTAYVEFLKKVYEKYQTYSNKKDVAAVPILAYMSGRVAALDPRLVDPHAEDHPRSKVNVLVGEVTRVHRETTPNKSTQLIFMENYRPMNTSYLRNFAAGQGITLDMGAEDQSLEVESGFNLFDDIRKKLVTNGIPTEEIAVINDFDTAAKQSRLFDDMNAGKIRIMMGGTDKMGTGVNVQEKLYALWHLDTPWMPAQLEQRNGRQIRQGNENAEVENSSIGMERTLDAGLHTKIGVKAKFFRQILSGRFTGREFDDPTGPLIISAEEQQALLSGNPLVLKKVEVDNKVRNLLLEEEGYTAGKGQTRYRLRNEEAYVRDTERELTTMRAGAAVITGKIDGETWQAKIGAQELNERKAIIAAIDRIIGAAKVEKEVEHSDPAVLRKEGQLVVQLTVNTVDVKVYGGLYRPRWAQEGEREARFGSIFSVEGHDVYAGEAKTGNGILGVLSDLPSDLAGRIEAREKRIATASADIEKFRVLLEQPFDKADELKAAQEEQKRINAELLGEGDKEKEAAKELFDIGYSAAPLLSRIDAALNRAQRELDKVNAGDVVFDDPIKEEDAKIDELEARIKSLSARRNTVEKKRYEAALQTDLNVPYKWTPTGKAHRPLAASTPLNAEQVKRAFAPGIDILTDIKAGVQSLLLPSAQSAEHLRAAELVGSKLGAMHRRQESAKAMLNKDWTMFEKMGVHREDVALVKNPGIEFMSDVSQAREVSPELSATRDKIDKIFASRLEALEKADAPVETVRDHYFPGLWTTESRKAFNASIGDAITEGIIDEDFDPNRMSDTQESWIRDRTYSYLDRGEGSDKDASMFLSRRPLKGYEKFRKPKVFDDIMTAVRLGLIPVSNNPINIVFLKLAEIDKSIMAHEVYQELKTKNQLKIITPFTKPPDGWEKVSDKYGTIYGGPGEAKEDGEPSPYIGLPIMGYRVVPKAVADIFNNYLSSSLYNNRYFGTLFTGWMGTANALNQTQLGVGSAFHAGFTTAEAQISAGANLIKDIYGLVRGNRSFNQLLKTTGSMFTASVETAMTGDSVLNAWRNPDGVIDKRIAQVVRAAEIAGAGFKLELGLQTQQTSKFLSDWMNGHRIRAAARTPVAFVEMLAKPIMEYLVPRQKAGVFAHLVWRIIEMNPGRSLDSLRPEFRQAWNRIDSRLGQVRYDRLFINNIAKNVVQGTVRAPGWSAGTIAELGGAFKDAYDFFGEWAGVVPPGGRGGGGKPPGFGKGKLPPNIPDRVAYAISLLVTVAALNALLTWLFSGTKPEGLDYWAFRTGGKDLYGNPERFVLPTYVKDIISYMKQPFTTLMHKSHPLLSVFGDLLKNKDYYGVEIRDSDSNALAQAVDAGGYVAKSFEPFWIRGAKKEVAQAGMSPKVLLPLIGVMPATRKMTETSAQALASKINEATIPAAPQSQRIAERRIEKSTITTQIRRGLQPDITGALSRGNIKPTDIQELYKRARLAPIAVQVEHMTLENAEKVYLRANAKERQDLAGAMARKRANSLRRQGRTMFTGF